jgi:hypothetical protein
LIFLNKVLIFPWKKNLSQIPHRINDEKYSGMPDKLVLIERFSKWDKQENLECQP